MWINIFKGKFRVIGLYAYNADEGWVCAERYDNLVWEFIEEEQSYDHRDPSFRGILREHMADVTHVTEYAYFSADMMLVINRSEYCVANGSLIHSVDKCYRVVRGCADELWLCELDGSEEIKLKLLINKM